MAGQGFGRWHKATALVPLGLVSAAWTASLVAGPAATTLASEQTTDPAPAAALPDGASVPTAEIEAPASVSSSDSLSAGLTTSGKATQVVNTASTAAIPSAALSAYQRAETVINTADESCNITWQLIAAIGRVESNHGRYGGNVLDADGVASPGIFGPALNGKKGVRAISDTDAGRLDGDSTWDRAVGPMQFIPSTWAVVGVDADGDAQLATAVYLCSGNDDLSKTTGQEKAVYRYNNSRSYVDLVLQIMDAYASGDYTSVPTGVSAAGVIPTDPAFTPTFTPEPQEPKQTAEVVTPSSQPTQAPPSSQPTQGSGGQGSGNNNGGNNNGGSAGGLGIPGAPTITAPTLPTTGVTVVDEVLTYAQAVLQCTLDGYIDNILKSNDPFDKCVEGYMNP